MLEKIVAGCVIGASLLYSSCCSNENKETNSAINSVVQKDISELRKSMGELHNHLSELGYSTDKLDLSTPEKTLDLFIKYTNHEEYNYKSISKFLTGLEVPSYKFRTEEDYRKFIIEDLGLIKNDIVAKYDLSEKVNVILSRGIPKVRMVGTISYIFTTLVKEEEGWKIFLADTIGCRLIKIGKSPTECQEYEMRSDVYETLKELYKEKLNDLFPKAKIKENLIRCADILQKGDLSKEYLEETLNKEKEKISKWLEELK